jgi:N-acetylneuraminic acid mutarotase
MLIFRPNQGSSTVQYVNITLNQPVTTTVTQATGNLEVIPYGQAVSTANLYANETNETFITPIELLDPIDNNDASTRKFLFDTIFPVTQTGVAPILNQYANKGGDTFTGPVSRTPDPYSLSNAPANVNTAITNKYANDKLNQAASLVAAGNAVVTGQIYEIYGSTTPSGYLKCNGAAVSKTTYSDLYGVIGDDFALLSPIKESGGTPWQSQYGFNPSTQSDITGWTSANSLTTLTAHAASLVTKNYIYILGGRGSSNESLDIIQRASFDVNGNLTSVWSVVGNLPAFIRRMGYVASKDRLYLIAGYDGSVAFSTVYSAPINADGTLGTFRAEPSLPEARYSPVCFVIKNKLYTVGGWTGSITNGNNINTVYRATINNDGTLSSWETLPNFPVNFHDGKALIIKDRIYIFGSYDSNNSYIYYATYDSNGNIGTWNYVANMPNNICISAIVCTDNYVFSIGGYSLNNSKYTNASYLAPILTDGSIGSWTQISNYPDTVAYGQSVIVGNKIYFIGGTNTNNYLDTVYSATFNSGITDYTQYYTDQPNTSSTFMLPNLPSTSYSAYYIKT